jgi:hypothetical protein
MTKKEFLTKHAYIADKYGNQNGELESDLNSVIKEECIKFGRYVADSDFYTYSIEEIYNNRKP